MYTEKKQEESLLITLLANDSELAFKLLYEQYSNRIYKLSIRYLKSPPLAQEIVQDVFLKLWFERKNMKPDKPVEAWLLTVAKNKLINQFRKMTNEWNTSIHLNDERGADHSNAESKLMHAEFEQQLHTMIDRLPQMQKRVFHFAKDEGLSYSEIGSKLNISPLTVKTHMARALDKIRKSLKQYGISY
ncbi:MAG: RNA polymerase sigma-70 factor [Chitinophagaceae bacterium]